MVGQFPYRMTAIQEVAAQRDLDVNSLNEGDLALLVHLASFFRAKAMKVFRPTIQDSKRSYDEREGDSYKTLFALKDITDPQERHFVTQNVFSLATVNGCTGGRWGCAKPCYLAALQIKDLKLLEVIPLEQKKHFFDEVLGPMDSDQRQDWVGNFYMHDDNDPFDDPDIVELMDYLYNTYGVVTPMTTTVPAHAEEAFKRLAGDAAKYNDVLILEEFVAEVKRVREGLEKSSFSSIADWEAKCTEVSKPYDEWCGLLDSLAWDLNDYGHEGITPRKLWVEPESALAGINSMMELVGQPLIGMDDSVTWGPIQLLINGLKVKKREALVEAGLDLDLKLTGISIDCYDLLKNLGFKDSDDFLDLDRAEFLERVKLEVSVLKESLQGRADMGDFIRVTSLDKTESRNSEWDESEEFLFKNLKGSEFMVAGKVFYDSKKKVGGYALDCHDGVAITAFGVFNTLAGKVTRDFPRGRVMVPFKGFLREENALAKEGDSVENILENVVVMRSPHFKHAPKKNPYKEVFIYDGSQRVRKICFDHETYKVITDVVVQENVESMNDLTVEYERTNI
jgi:hypothetical protein